MHFALSLEGEIKNYNFKEVTEEEFKDYAKYDLYEIIDKCFTIYGTVLGDTIALGLCLGFTLEQLEEVYYKKNKIKDRKSTRLNSSHPLSSRMPSSA